MTSSRDDQDVNATSTMAVEIDRATRPSVTPARDASAQPLRITGLRKSYGPHVVLSDVTMSLRAGTITGLLGPNGAGKTTTLRAIGGLLRPDAGQVEIFGIDAGTSAARSQLGYLPADPVFAGRSTGAQNLRLLRSLRPESTVDDHAAIAERVGLSQKDLARPVHDYSSGMRQKLGIVAALQHKPGLIVLDEPANRLDPIAQRAFAGLVRDAADEGAAVLLSSHLLAEVEEICGEVVMMSQGALLESVRIDELRRRAARKITVCFDDAARRLPGIENATIDGATLQGTIPARRPDLIGSLANCAGVTDILVEPASLEEVFLRMYREQQ